jgi:RNA polymerase sigma factor (sigma-70 family)
MPRHVAPGRRRLCVRNFEAAGTGKMGRSLGLEPRILSVILTGSGDTIVTAVVSMKKVPRHAPELAAPLPEITSLFRAYAAQVERWVTRLAGPGIDAEDVVQDVFLVVQRRMGEWRADAKVTTWLYRITERVVRRQRDKQRIGQWLQGLTNDFAEEIPSDRLTPVGELERKQAKDNVHAALATLEPKQREVVVLFELEGLSGHEIADRTDTKRATVWVRLHRGRARFRKRLQELEDLQQSDKPANDA